MKSYLLLIVIPFAIFGQSNSKKLKVLFLGNSYTYVNNLPQMVADIASSMGDTLLFDSNCPGGHTFNNHVQNGISLAKIAQGNWTHVVLQAQSQEPSFSPQQVNAQTLPYAIKLDSLIKLSNPCASTVFYETWGRKNGDASNCPFYPPVCTYTGMQNRLRDSYLLFADTCKGLVAPAGEAWRASISFSPSLELYSPDQSHPSMEGSFLTAAVFYETLFQKSVVTSTYSAGLSTLVATHLRQTAHATVNDSAYQWHIGKFISDAVFTSSLNGMQLSCFARSNNFTHNWDFGDGNQSGLIAPVHNYLAAGQYTVVHRVDDGCKIDVFNQVVLIASPTSLSQSEKTAFGLETVFENELTIKTDNSSEFVVRIVDLQGKEMYRSRRCETITTSTWPDGLYIVEINTGKTLQYYKIIKDVSH